jgi:hypothetical protein
VAASVQEWGIGALGNMAMDPDIKDVIGEEGGCSAVISAMHSHVQHVERDDLPFESDNLLFHGCLALVSEGGKEGGGELCVCVCVRERERRGGWAGGVGGGEIENGGGREGGRENSLGTSLSLSHAHTHSLTHTHTCMYV